MAKPRTVHGAINRGWCPVKVTIAVKNKHNVSHLGLCIWADRNKKFQYVTALELNNTSVFVFENATDAFWFISRWKCDN